MGVGRIIGEKQCIQWNRIVPEIVNLEPIVIVPVIVQQRCRIACQELVDYQRKRTIHPGLKGQVSDTFQCTAFSGDRVSDGRGIPLEVLRKKSSRQEYQYDRDPAETHRNTKIWKIIVLC